MLHRSQFHCNNIQECLMNTVGRIKFLPILNPFVRNWRKVESLIVRGKATSYYQSTNGITLKGAVIIGGVQPHMLDFQTLSITFYSSQIYSYTSHIEIPRVWWHNIFGILTIWAVACGQIHHRGTDLMIGDEWWKILFDVGERRK